jgi:putative membrane protein
MTAPVLINAGLAVLVLAWAGPLPGLVRGSFAAHMALHMAVVGIGVPLLAAGLAQRLRGVRVPRVYPLVARLVDFAVIWVWHAPALHTATRVNPMILTLEQASFAAAALLVWLVALTGPPLAGALELFFTSMHMVLLGALMTLAPRDLYALICGPGTFANQQLGGAIMLAIGGVVYLGGGLMLVRQVLRPVVPA